MQTIKELADALGVSKTAVRKYMTPEFRAEYTETRDGNIILIDDAGCKLITETVKKVPGNTANQLPETTGNPGFQEELAFLREQLQAKDRQLEAKDRQLEQKDKQLEARDAQIASLTQALEHTTASLQAAHALHAGTMQQALPDGRAEAAVTAEVVEVPPEPSEPVRKGGFWQWFKDILK